MENFSLGDVLVHMGLVTEKEVRDISENMTNATREDIFGKIMVAHGIITPGQLVEAKKLLDELKSTNSMVRGEAASELAQRHMASVTSIAGKVRAKATQVNSISSQQKKTTGGQYTAITPELLKSKI